MPHHAAFASAGLQVFERGWLSANNILFAGRDGGESVLVDSGYCSHAEQTVALMKQALGGLRLDRIVNTHLHSDHCGGNAALQSAYGCAVDVPAGEVDKVDRWDETALTFRDTGQRCPRFSRRGALRAGETVTLGPKHWQVHAAPGHDPESIVLYQPELQILISADALWENGFGVVFPELEGFSAFDAVSLTLDQMSDLPVRWVIPGHGAPFSDMSGALDRAKRRLDSLVRDPAKHARHAAKVLIKFHLLEMQAMSLAQLLGWFESMRYAQMIHSRYFAAMPFEAWEASLVGELRNSAALRVEKDLILNQ